MEEQELKFESEEVKTELEFSVENIQLPELKSNFEKFKSELILSVEKFKIEVTEDNIQEAKKMMSSLNKIKASITQKSKETVAIFKKPVDSFRQQISELESICDSSRADISLQVQKFEDATKAECERLLKKLVADLRADFKVLPRFYSAKIDDLIKLTAVTAKGGLVKSIKETVLSRVQKEQFDQTLYHGRYKEVESECLKNGIDPFTEYSVSHMLLLDYDKFKANLADLVRSEIDRNNKIRIKLEAEAEEKSEKKAKEDAEKERRRVASEAQKKYKSDYEKEQAEELAQKAKVVPVENEDRKTGRTNSLYTQQLNEGKEVVVPQEKFRSFANHDERSVSVGYNPKPLPVNEWIEKGENETVIRPSSLPRVLLCTNSRHAPEIKIEEKFAGNIEGVALDAFANKYFTSENTDIKAIIGEVEDFYKVDVAYLCWNLAKMLLKYRSSLKNIEAQKKVRARISSGIVEGTMDLMGWIDETKAVIIDNKAGFAGSDYTAQLKGYTLAMFKTYPKLEKIGIITAYASSSKIKTEAFTRADSEKFEAELFEIYSGKKNGYNVGDNCTYCPLRYECGAKQGVLNGTIASLLENNVDTIDQLDTSMLEKVGLIDKAIKKFKELFKQKVEAEGEVRIGINTYYIAKDAKEHFVLTPESFEYLHGIFGSQMTKFLSISETELKELKMSEAPKGLKIAEWRAFFEELNKKGFTEKVINERLAKK